MIMRARIKPHIRSSMNFLVTCRPRWIVGIPTLMDEYRLHVESIDDPLRSEVHLGRRHLRVHPVVGPLTRAVFLHEVGHVETMTVEDNERYDAAVLDGRREVVEHYERLAWNFVREYEGGLSPDVGDMVDIVMSNWDTSPEDRALAVCRLTSMFDAEVVDR
jgi:hypothetical protein